VIEQKRIFHISFVCNWRGVFKFIPFILFTVVYQLLNVKKSFSATKIFLKEKFISFSNKGQRSLRDKSNISNEYV